MKRLSFLISAKREITAHQRVMRARAPRLFATLPSSARCAVTMLVIAALLPVGAARAQDGTRPQAAGASAVSVPRAIKPQQVKPRRPVVDKLQQRVDMVLRNRLQLSDDQFNKLREMNGRLDEERMGIRKEENTTRRALREQLLPGAKTDDARVTELLDKLPQIERKRIALQEREQKELAGFLQPAQRARYFALQDEIRRSLQDVQRLRVTPGDSVRLPPPQPLQRGRGGRLNQPFMLRR